MLQWQIRPEAMAKNFFSSPNFTTSLTSPTPSKNLNTSYLSFTHYTSHSHKPKKDFSLQASAYSTSHSSINVDYLAREFSGHGVKFTPLGDRCAVQMALEDGSTATLMLPSGVITSYKPHMWHGGMMELLHTLVSEGKGGGPLVQGGVSLDFKCGTHYGGIPWSPSTLALHNVRGSPQDSIQVELMCSDTEAMVEFKYIVTLQQDVLISEVMITNLNSSSIHFMGSLTSHLTVSTPDATYAIGLQGSSYFNKPPLTSDFSIIPPDVGRKVPSNLNQTWGFTALQGLMSSWGVRDNESDNKSGYNKEGKLDNEVEQEGEEDDDYAHLTEKMSRIYTNSPRKFTVIDRGRRNSVIVGKDGFEELYIYSPGSHHKWYGKYAYICTGPSVMLKPVTLGPEGVWRGAQYLHNPNN